PHPPPARDAVVTTSNTSAPVHTAVRVTAPARLHLGLLETGGDGRRQYGGLGVGIAEPCTGVRVVGAEATTAEGPEADRARLFAMAAIRSLGLPDGAHVQVQRAIEPHRGLGSGTKLGLAIASGLATLHGIAATTGTLATAVARGERSAVGVWTFDAPGL